MNKKYLAAAAIVGGMSFLPLANPASAATVSDNKATIPVKLTITSENTSGYNVSIGDAGDGTTVGTEHILMTQTTKDSNAATVTSLTIQNKAVSAPVYVKGIKAEPLSSGDYTVVSYDTGAFKTYDIDSKKIALRLKTVGAGETADLFTGWAGSTKIEAATSLKKELDGLTTLSTAEISAAQVANCVITLGLTGPAS